MTTEDLGKSWYMNLLARPGGMTMESRLRHWFMNPKVHLEIAGVKPGSTVLEVGSGTGFYTIPAAELIGEEGHLIAMDPLRDFVNRVRQKAETANLHNVEVIQRDALQTGLEAARIDQVLLFGVLPFPTLPLNILLPEMHRVLKPGGALSIWMFPFSAGVPTAIRKSGLFKFVDNRKSVYNFLKA